MRDGVQAVAKSYKRVVENFEQGRQRRKNDPELYLTSGDAVYLYKNSLAEISKLLGPFLERPEDLATMLPSGRKLLAIDVQQ